MDRFPGLLQSYQHGSSARTHWNLKTKYNTAKDLQFIWWLNAPKMGVVKFWTHKKRRRVNYVASQNFRGKGKLHQSAWPCTYISCYFLWLSFQNATTLSTARILEEIYDTKLVAWDIDANTVRCHCKAGLGDMGGLMWVSTRTHVVPQSLQVSMWDHHSCIEVSDFPGKSPQYLRKGYITFWTRASSE